MFVKILCEFEENRMLIIIQNVDLWLGRYQKEYSDQSHLHNKPCASKNIGLCNDKNESIFSNLACLVI